MDAQIVLREVAPTAAHLIYLNQVSGDGLDAGVQRQPIALRSREFKSDPVIMVPAHPAKSHRLAVQILDHDVHVAIIEEIPDFCLTLSSGRRISKTAGISWSS